MTSIYLFIYLFIYFFFFFFGGGGGGIFSTKSFPLRFERGGGAGGGGGAGAGGGNLFPLSSPDERRKANISMSELCPLKPPFMFDASQSYMSCTVSFNVHVTKKTRQQKRNNKRYAKMASG